MVSPGTPMSVMSAQPLVGSIPHGSARRLALEGTVRTAAGRRGRRGLRRLWTNRHKAGSSGRRAGQRKPAGVVKARCVVQKNYVAVQWFSESTWRFCRGSEHIVPDQ